MNKHIPPVLFCVIVVLTALLFNGCIKNAPPNVDEIYREFQENQKDFQLIADYFLDTDYESIFINRGDEFFWADFHQYPFVEVDGNVYSTISYMFNEKGYLGISKNSTQLGVEFRMWTDNRSIDCGVVYAISSDTEPQPEFVTELVPLPEEGWYYYVSDYNEWRSQRNLSA